VFANEPDECGSVCFPVFGKAFEIFKDCVETVFREERDSVFGVFVEVGVEDALIHEVCVFTDVEEYQRR
jgi:hypothetical protein